MNLARRFAGAGAALLGLALAAGLWWSVQPVESAPVEQAAIFRFEKEDLVGIRVIRTDQTLSFARVADRWETVGESWRPSASMVRRIGHQLHDLTARAAVVEATDEPERYGLGEGAIRVELDLRDGQTMRFAVGDPNPSSVSWYMRPLPDGPVYVVKKAAVDYYRLDATAFREDRFAFFDAADCEAITTRVAGQEHRFRRTGERSWALVWPEQWRADRDKVRRILGSVAAARAQRFVADHPPDLSVWGLGEDADQVVLTLTSGEPITIRLGRAIAETDPPQRYAWRAEDDAVYAVRASIADPMEESTAGFRDPRVLDRGGFEIRSILAVRGEEQVRVESSADSWRWEEGAAVPGATPRRVASAVAELRATAFHEAPAARAQPADGSALTVTFNDDTSVQLFLGPSEGSGCGVWVDGDPVAYTVSTELNDRLDDLFRERRRWLDKSDERR